MADKNYVVWDLATRLFHWLLAVLFLFSIFAHQVDEIEWHYYSGLSILSLIIFRLIWGIFGSHYSRFAEFVASPITVIRYLKGNLVKPLGHNPLGSWSVIAMLLAILIQACTGLFMTDEVLFDGPWFPAINEETAGVVGLIHEINSYVLYGLAGLHVMAIAYYQLVKKQRLIQAMFSGKMRAQEGLPEYGKRSQWLALLVTLVGVAAVIAIIWFAPEPVSVDF